MTPMVRNLFDLLGHSSVCHVCEVYHAKAGSVGPWVELSMQEYDPISLALEGEELEVSRGQRSLVDSQASHSSLPALDKGLHDNVAGVHSPDKPLVREGIVASRDRNREDTV